MKGRWAKTEILEVRGLARSVWIIIKWVKQNNVKFVALGRVKTLDVQMAGLLERRAKTVHEDVQGTSKTLMILLNQKKG